MRLTTKLLFPMLLCLVSSAAKAYCFEDASIRYDVPSGLLKAIAHVESRMNPMAMNTNTNGSNDIGLMQINTSWLPTLSKHGITRENLWDPCTNVLVGAWVLAKNIASYGYTWEAVGAYNARSKEKRKIYAEKVFVALKSSSGK